MNYSGTNKLRNCQKPEKLFSYDANGSLIQDALNNNNEMLYDHGNLITELKHRSMIIGDTVYLTKYYYDEAGNRIRKMTYAYLGSISESEPPANSDVSNTSNWALRNDEVYSRDVSGKEMAIYQNNSLLEYPAYGLDMIGKIKDDELHFYLKDHLGSIRATIYDNKLMSAQDYDAWGYILEGRTYESEQGKFKFTGKERDEESFYDYFGARYYDARIGRWGQVEPLLDKYLSFSPYQYSMLNPLLIKDINGKDGKVTITGNKVSLEVNLYFAINSETNPQGLTDKQIKAIGEFQQKIENSYSGKFEINGKNYDVTTKFNLILEDSYENAVFTRFENEGSNIIENAGADNELLREADFGVAVTSGYDLILASGSALNPDSDTGEHELTHLLGLKGDDLNDSSIENYGRPRQKPNGETFKKIFDINNVNIKSNETQILRGYIK